MNNLNKSISTRTGAVKLALAVVISLIILKVLVSIISKSISISAQAADSLLDLFSIGITFVAIRMSVAPADNEHPFGHGKMEGFAALIQALLVLGAGGFIIYSAIQRILHSTPIEPNEGMVVMVISIIASFFLSRHLQKVAKSTGSLAIEASARNISADVYSAAGVLIGLLVVRLTNLVILDPIIALIMAGFVLKAGFAVSRDAFNELTDYQLPTAEQDLIKKCIQEHNTQLVNFHSMRSRRSGNKRFVDLHLVMPRNLSVEESHQMCDHLEKDITDRLTNTDVDIHVEPCSGIDCSHCLITNCSLRHL
ncbi:MAG: cation diffusion facilitator family transporter [Dehalococcoidales bacterium]|nr:cation diffusion facilitator family transporter [Dehalococcoidales bacterium]